MSLYVVDQGWANCGLGLQGLHLGVQLPPVDTIIYYFNPFFHIYSFQHVDEKSFRKTLWKKVKLLKMSNFTFIHNVFSAILSKTPLMALFQLLSAVSLNLGQAQNGVLGNGLMPEQNLCHFENQNYDFLQWKTFFGQRIKLADGIDLN